MAESAGILGSIHIQRLNCLDFDGTGDLVTITDHADFTFGTSESFALEVWVAPDGTSLGNIVTNYGTSNGFQLEIDGSGYAKFTVGDGTNTPAITGTTDITDGAWHHIVAVRDVTNDLLYLYVDGSSDNTAVTDTTNGNIDGGNLIFGGATTTGFEGKLGDVTLWNAALSSAQVTAQYNGGNGIVNDTTMNGDASVTVVSAWHLDEGSGATVYDIGSGNHHGTITNAAWSTWAVTVTNEAVGTGDDSDVTFALDHANADNIVISVDAVVQGTQTYSVTPKGDIVFDTAPGVGLAITATYTYAPTAEIGGFFDWTFTRTCDIHDTTDFSDAGNRTYIAGLKSWSGSANRHYLHPYVLRYVGQRCIVKFYLDGSDRYEGWAIVNGLSPSLGVDTVLNEAVTFTGCGDVTLETT